MWGCGCYHAGLRDLTWPGTSFPWKESNDWCSGGLLLRGRMVLKAGSACLSCRRAVTIHRIKVLRALDYVYRVLLILFDSGLSKVKNSATHLR